MASNHDDHAINVGPDGSHFEQLVVTGHDVMRGDYHGGVCVEIESSLDLLGELHGSLRLHEGALAVISGHHHGSLHVEPRAEVRVTGRHNGSLHVEPGGVATIEVGGRVAGSMQNDGLVILRGAFGGSQSGRGDLRIEGNGHLKQPTTRGGVNYYDWND